MNDHSKIETSGIQISDRIGRLFWPNSVAVVGASASGGFASEILKNIRKWGFAGEIHAVNPRYEEVEGVRCYPNIAAIGEPVGLVIIGVPSIRVPEVLYDCEGGRVGAVQIISSGFSDIGEEGRPRQAALADWAELHSVPVAGPNCLGLLNAANGLIALQTPFQSMKAGGVSAVLQSGLLAPSFLMPLLARGVGIGRVVTTGNEANLDAADFIDYLSEDDETRVIACYCEQIKRPREFVLACEKAADRSKPIVMIKIGRSRQAQQTALAHTGSLAGSDVAADTLLKKLGIERVDTIDDLIETSLALSTPVRPRGKRVAFLSFSGGAAGLVADLAEPCDINLAPVPEETEQQLQAVVPEFCSVSNPLDLTGQAVYEPEIVAQAVDILAKSGAYDAIIWGRDFPSPMDMQSAIGTALHRAAERTPEVLHIVMGMVGGHFFNTPDPARIMALPQAELRDMPFLQGTATALKALSALFRYAEFAAAWPSRRRISMDWPTRSVHCHQASAILDTVTDAVLPERVGMRLLDLYGIPVARDALARSPEEAAKLARTLKLPVAMKLEAAGIAHKSELGGVVLNVRSAEEAAAAYRNIVQSARSLASGAEVAGVLVQEMASGCVEMMLGAKFVPQLGPIIALGLGGIWVEALRDIRFLMPPVDHAEVTAALARLRGIGLLKGGRGRPKADLDALADCVVRFSQLCGDLAGRVEVIDINPIILGSEGEGLKAVDCVIVKRYPVAEAGHRDA